MASYADDMDSRRVGPAIRRRLGVPSSMYNQAERTRFSAPADDQQRQYEDEMAAGVTMERHLQDHSGIPYADHDGSRARQEGYTPPMMPEIPGDHTGVVGTLRGGAQEVSGERNGIHRGYDAVTDYAAMAQYFEER